MNRDNNYWLRSAAGSRFSRRRFVGGSVAGGAGLAGLALVGCGDDDDDTGPTTAPGTTATSAPGTSPTAGATATPAGQPVAGGVLQAIWLGGSQFDSTDVHRAFRDEVQWLSNRVLNKVIRYSAPDAGSLEGDLADDWESPDGQTYIFNLRPNVKWQETSLTGGRQFTSEDIKWHIERQREGKLLDGTETTFRFQSTFAGAQVETPDDLTVKVTLPTVKGDFLHELANFRATVPNREATEAFEADHNTLRAEAMPATGQFIIKRWQANEDVHIARNPDYFREGRPLLDGMILPVGLFADPSAARLAFEQKQIDYWGAPDSSVTAAILESNKDQMYEVLTGIANTVFLHTNMNKQFKDVRLVQAMNMAVDRRSMIQTFHQGLGQVSGPVTWIQDGWALPPTELVKYPGYRENRDEDIKEARALWEAGGGPALGDVDIKSIDTWLGPYPDTQQFMIQMFNEALGVSQFKSTRGTYNDDVIPLLGNGEFANWMAWTSQVSTPDPRTGLFSSFATGASGNFQNVSNAELDGLLTRALETVDEEQAKDLITQAQILILENGQFGNINLYNYIGRSASWNYHRGVLKEEPTGGKPGVGYTISTSALVGDYTWLDTGDPTYSPSVGNRVVV
jgi:peptide/nickel transport system substrate-binding protein